MSSETFQASVQYNDLTGSAAADRADQGDATQWLKNNGLINGGEFLIGIEIYILPSTILPKDEIVISTSFIISEANNFESASNTIRETTPVKVRKVTRDLSPKEFFSLFKRFNVTLSGSGVLEGREYDSE